MCCLELGDGVADFSGLHEELKRSGDSMSVKKKGKLFKSNQTATSHTVFKTVQINILSKTDESATAHVTCCLK